MPSLISQIVKGFCCESGIRRSLEIMRTVPVNFTAVENVYLNCSKVN